MFCPRCGMENADATKFCRQCGLSLAQVTGMVTGGTGALHTPPPQSVPPQPMFVPGQLPETSQMLALKQKRTMTMMAMGILPVVLTILSDQLFNAGEVTAVLFLLIPLGMVWASSRYKVELRRLQEEQWREYQASQPPAYSQPLQPPQPRFQTLQTPPPAPQLPPPTNPFHQVNPAHGSVIEDETRKLPIRNQS
jgi:zinc-ribbon domain